MGEGERLYTRAEVSRAVNDAVDAVVELAYEDVESTLYLVVNLALTWLDHPGWSVAEVIEENYSDPPEAVLSWVYGPGDVEVPK